jgi:serine/threonine protein kinase
MPIQIGDILGDYQITGILGRGGMGRVFRVRSLVTEREEAMKIVLPDLDEDRALADRFLHEIKVHASLQHPNIAALHTALRIEGRLVMFMELVEGVSLEQKLRDGPIDIRPALDYMNQVLSALAFAHQRGVIHRDIKPANILIASESVAKLTDFGIARSTGATRLTGTGLAVGTLTYMSPEQILAGPIDARSDIYSLGLTLYETLVGRRAIQADTDHALMNAQLHVMPAPPAVLNPLVPDELSAAIMRALAKEPDRRFQTAMEFESALQQLNLNQSPAILRTSAIPAQELVELEAHLARALGPIARRLVADAARRYGALSEIRKALAAHIEDPKAREEFFKTDTGASATTVTQVPPASLSFDPATLEGLAQALAPYLGPIAKLLVSRAARTARNVEEMRNMLAAEIPSAEDRQRFLAAVRSAL